MPPYVSDDVPVMRPPSTGSDTTIVAAIDSGATPMVPGSQPQADHAPPPATQPDRRQRRAAAAAAMSPLAVEIPQRKPVKRKRARTGLRLVMMLVVLGAIVAGAILFGRPYLFPDDSAANASPYAEAIKQVTGSAFTNPDRDHRAHHHPTRTRIDDADHRRLVDTAARYGDPSGWQPVT